MNNNHNLIISVLGFQSFKDFDLEKRDFERKVQLLPLPCC